jgi:hypothetical protein
VQVSSGSSSGSSSVCVAGGVEAHDRHVDALERGLLVGKCPRAFTARRIRELTDSIAFVTGMKDRGAAGPVGLIAAGGVGCGRSTVRPSGTGAPGVKQGGQAGLVRWAESPC